MTYSEWQKKYGKKIADNKTSATNSAKELAEKAENWHKKYNPPKTVSAPTKTALKTVADATGGVFAGSSPEKKLADVKTALTGITGISRDSIVKANPTTYVNNTGRVLTRNDGGTAESRTAEAKQRLAAAKEANEKRQKENERLLSIDIDAKKNEIEQLKTERKNLQDQYRTTDRRERNSAQMSDNLRRIDLCIDNITDEIAMAEKARRENSYTTLSSNADYAEKSKSTANLFASADSGDALIALVRGNDQEKAEVLHDYINGADYAKEAIAKKDRTQSKYGDRYRKYGMMTNDEVSRYNYLYNTKGYEAATKYLSDIEGTLNARLGQQNANEMNDVQRAVFGVEAGRDNFMSGIQQYFTNEVKPVSVTQTTGQAAREHLGKVGQFAYDFAQLAGNMAPSILLSAVTGGAGAAVGSVSMGASAAGNAYAEMMRETGNRNKARTYAGLVGASESALSYALSGIGKLGGKAINATKLAKNIATIDSIWARTAAQFAKSGISEGFEETLQEYLEPLFYASIYGGDYEAPDVKDALRTFALAALSGGVFEGPSIVAGAVADSANKTAFVNDIFEAVYKSDNGMLDQLISDSVAGTNGKKAQKIATALQEKIANGKEVSGADIRKLATPAAKHNKNRVTAESLEKNKAATASMLDSYIAKHLDSKKPKTGLETAKQEMERKTEGVRRADADAMLKNPSAVEALKEYGYDPAAKDKVASVRAAIKKMAAENVTGTMAVDSAIARYTKEVAADSVPIKTEATEVTADTAENNIPAEAKFEPTMNTNENTEVIDNAEGDLHLRYGSERNDGADSSVPVRSMEESAGRDSGGKEIRSRPRDEEAANVTPAKKVKGSAVIEGGIDNDLYLYEYTATKHTRKAKEYADARGLKLVLFGGDSLKVMQDDRIVSAKGAIRGDTIYVRVDHPDFTADQIALHEITHDKINKGEISVKDVRDRINDLLDPAEVEQLVEMYIAAYHGSKADEMRIFTEIICDAEAGLNEFVGTLKEESARKLLENTRIATEENIEERRTRGPPAENADTQFSRDENERSRALKRGEMVNGFRDKINWHRYYEKILDKEYNPMYYDDGELTYMQLDGSLLTLRMRRNGEWEVIELEEGNNVYILGDDGNVVLGSQGQKLAGQLDRDISGNGLQVEKSRRDTSKGSRNNQDRRESESSSSRSSADYSGNVSRETDTSVNRGSAIYIKDGHTEDGKTVDFVSLILDGKKKGETRTHKNITRKWVGIAKDGYVYGRVKFGEPYLIDKNSPEYKDSYISGTEYDLKDNEQKYYYPVEGIEDFRDDPKPIAKNGNYATYYFSEELDIKTRKEHNQITIDHFGKTNKWDETGYILLDGSRLDFSGRHDGAEGGYRTVDHRDIRDALGDDYGGEDYSGGMVQFMAEGNIRVMPESNGLNLSVAPTKEQERTIEMFVARKHGEIILDIDDVNGKTVSSTEYPRGTTATRVLSDIHRFFKEGSTPRVSSVAMFHDTDFSEEISEIQDLRKENARLRKQLAHWKNEVKVTERPTVRRDDVEKLARRIRKDYHSTLPLDKVTEHINELANFLARHEDVTWNGMRRMTEGIARQIVESAEVLNDEAWKSYKEMRDYIRSHKFVLSPEEASSIADFAAWKKLNRKYFGGIEIGKTNVDKTYSEMSNLWPEFFNEQRESNPADQMLTIVETMDKLKPVFENPYDFNLSAATEYVANDIMESILSPDLRRVKTYADRANEKLQRAKQKRIDDLRKRSQSANARAVRDKIIRHSSKLYNDLGTIRKDRNIPEHLRAPVAAVLEAINFESKNTVVENENGKRVIAPKGVEGDPTKRTQKFEALKKAYEKLAESAELVVDIDVFDPKSGKGTLQEVIKMRDKRLDDMNVQELQKVWDVVKSMETAITNWNKAFRAAKDESISDQVHALEYENANKNYKKQFSIGGKVLKLLEVDNLTPEAFFHRLGKKGDELFRMLRKAQDDSIRVLAETAKFTSDLVSNQDVRKLSRVVYSVKLGGKNVKMTAAQLMELYALTGREQALMHILAGGIRLDAQDVGKVTKLSTEGVITGITIEELNEAFKKLTAEQKDIIIALQKFASTKLSEYGNKATMEVYGVKKFTEEVYWPIRTHSNDLVQEQAQTENKVESVENFGMSKATKPDAKTSVKIGSAFETFADHTVQMATYYGYLAALIDLNRIRNHKAGDGTVKDIINRVVGRGDQGAKYLGKLMADISSGAYKGDSDINLFSKIIGNYKAASVAANLRVVAQQPTAGLRALEIINPKYFVNTDKAMAGFEEAKKYAPIAQWKDWGYFETHTGRQVMDVMFNTDSTLDKVKNTTMALAGKADSMTWGMIWNACKRETADKNPGLTGEALLKKTSERFNEVIDRTQVVDGVLQRSQIMRMPGDETKLATAFMAEPTKTLNMFLSALYDYRYAKTADAKHTASKKLWRTSASIIAAGIVNSTIVSVIDAMRDDDEEKDYIERYLSNFGENALDQFNPMGMIPWIKSVWSAIQGFGTKDVDDAALDNIVNAIKGLLASDGKGKKSDAELIFTAIDAVAMAFGIPIKNARRTLISPARTLVRDILNDPVISYRFDRLFLRPIGNKGHYYDLAYAAYTTDEDAYNTIKKDLMKNGFSEDDIESAMLARTKKAFDGSAYAEEKFGGNAKLSSELTSIAKDGKLENIVPNEVSAKISWKDDKDVEHSVVLDEKDYKKYQQAVVDRAYGILTELTKNSKWKSLTDEQKKNAVSDVYSVARAYGKKQVSAYETETNWLMVALENAEYADEIAMFNILKKNYDKDKNGSLKQAELKEAIREIGSTRAERAALWDAASSDKDWKKRNPYD